MTTWIDTDPEGFPPGTYIVNHPPTCTSNDAYVAPTCSQWTQEIHWPDIIPPLGSVPLGDIAIVVAAGLILAGLVLLVVKIKDRRA